MSKDLSAFEKALLDAINQAGCDMIEYMAADHYPDLDPYQRTCKMMDDIDRILMQRFCPNLIGHPDIISTVGNTIT